MKQRTLKWALLLPLILTGCTTYTLKTITARQAGTDYQEGVTYRVAFPHAVLVRSMSFSWFGFGQPYLELTIVEIPEIGRSAIERVPRNTPLQIDRYVQYEQHGFSDCSADGWRFAIAHITEGELAGTRFLIEPTSLDVILNPKHLPGSD